MEFFQELSIPIIQALQSLSPTLDNLMEVLSFGGRLDFYLILIPLIYWCVDAKLGFRLLLAMILVDVIDNLLKHILHEPRPYWLYPTEVQRLAGEATYGFPSNHAGTTMAVYGWLAFRMNKGWLWLLTILVILGIGISRMFLGVHFLHDVLAGWVIGLLFLFLLNRLDQPVSRWLIRRPFPDLALLSLAAALLVILSGRFMLYFISSQPDPLAWSVFTSQARSATVYINSAGGITGMGIGYALMKNYAQFQAKGSWINLVLRFIVGIAGVLSLYFGLDFLFSLIAGDESFLGYLLRFIRYGVISLWVAFLAPWIFIRLRLAQVIW